jgi:nitrate/TMAO reductase-like tetraheme cytochrome c subunit
MKAINLATVGGLVVAAGLLLGLTTPTVHSDQTENHCFSCHTNPRKLIKITREIAHTNHNKPGASIKTKGEG